MKAPFRSMRRCAAVMPAAREPVVSSMVSRSTWRLKSSPRAGRGVLACGEGLGFQPDLGLLLLCGHTPKAARWHQVDVVGGGRRDDSLPHVLIR